MFILIVAAAVVIICASAVITTFPSNKVVVAGNKVILECRTNTSKKLIWKQRILDAVNDSVPLETIFTGNKFSNEAAQRYDIIRESDGQFDLKFNATFDHGNEYTCIEPGGHNFSSQVIVLASEPKCHVNGMPVTSDPIILDEEEYVELKCNLTFAGRWSPLLQWTQRINSENDWMHIAGQNKTEKRDKTFFFSTTLGFNATSNTTSFMCKTLFLESGRPKSITAENIPDYSHNWTSPTFVLRYLFLVSLILAALLFISVVVIISVTLHFTVCRKKAPGNVDNAASTSIANASEETPVSMHAYEDVDLESFSSRVAVTERIPADDKYSTLVKSDMTPPKSHNYETVNLSEMADDSNVMNARLQSEQSEARVERFPDYVNVLRN